MRKPAELETKKRRGAAGMGRQTRRQRWWRGHEGFCSGIFFVMSGSEPRWMRRRGGGHRIVVEGGVCRIWASKGGSVCQSDRELRWETAANGGLDGRRCRCRDIDLTTSAVRLVAWSEAKRVLIGCELDQLLVCLGPSSILTSSRPLRLPLVHLFILLHRSLFRDAAPR